MKTPPPWLSAFMAMIAHTWQSQSDKFYLTEEDRDTIESLVAIPQFACRRKTTIGTCFSA